MLTLMCLNLSPNSLTQKKVISFNETTFRQVFRILRFLLLLLADACGLGIQGLFARFIAFCLNEPVFASQCLQSCRAKWIKRGRFWEAKVDFLE